MEMNRSHLLELDIKAEYIVVRNGNAISHGPKLPPRLSESIRKIGPTPWPEPVPIPSPSRKFQPTINHDAVPYPASNLFGHADFPDPHAGIRGLTPVLHID